MERREYEALVGNLMRAAQRGKDERESYMDELRTRAGADAVTRAVSAAIELLPRRFELAQKRNTKVFILSSWGDAATGAQEAAKEYVGMRMVSFLGTLRGVEAWIETDRAADDRGPRSRLVVDIRNYQY